MGLPAELLPYAENIYRRFPEEFIALGAPGLESIFDLRPSGSWTRSIRETSTEKTVEVTIRRWSAPQLHHGAGPAGYPAPMPNPWAQPTPATAAPPPFGTMPFAGPGQPPQMMYPPYTAAPSAAPSAPPLATQAQASAPGATGEVERLGRLESALSALKPQIEALITMQAAAVSAGPAAASVPLVAPPAPGGTQTPPMPDGVLPGGTGTPPLSQPGGPLALKDRRNVTNLQIQTVPQAKPMEPVQQQPPPQQPQQPPPQQQQQQADPPRAGKDPAKFNTVDNRRPSVNISAVRLAPAALDPASPRSPGRFSAWK